MARLPALLCLTLLTAAPALADSRRVAVVVGNNAGSGDLPPLRYAESDAGKVARVLTELGDVAKEDVFLLQGRAVKDLEEAIRLARERITALKANPETRTLLLFYFSGHSDGESVELGPELLSYTRLKTLLSGTGADVRVIIVDACKSGSAVREKGGAPTAPFAIKLTDSLATTGEAFISSSAADEAALESSEVMGSIFTHHLVSGLRGAADVSGDRQVTLVEAYRYAHDQTVTRTAMLPVGSQHPSYDFQLSGQGELVLTSLVKASGLLVLPEGTERAVITDVTRDQVVAEVPNAAVREVALAPGPYAVRAFKQGQSFGGRVTVEERGRREVQWAELDALTSSTKLARKGHEVEQVLPPPGDTTWQDKRLVSLTLGATPAIANLGLKAAGRLAFEPRAGWGFSFALQGTFTQLGQAAEGGLEARAGFRTTFDLRPLWLSLGAEVGPAYVVQQEGATSGASFAFVAAPRAVGRVTVWGPLSLSLEVDLAVLVLSLDGQAQALFRPLGLLGVALAL